MNALSSDFHQTSIFGPHTVHEIAGVVRLHVNPLDPRSQAGQMRFLKVRVLVYPDVQVIPLVGMGLLPGTPQPSVGPMDRRDRLSHLFSPTASSLSRVFVRNFPQE
jgi:hypothetical protein